MHSPHDSLRRLSLAVLLAGILLLGFVLPLHIVASAQLEEFTCPPNTGDWDELTGTCTVDEFSTFSWGLHVPPTMTLVITDTFLNQPEIIGPGPGAVTIYDVIIDGHLVIVNDAVNYGPVLVNGRLTISGTWVNMEESHSGCSIHGCADSHVEGVVTNRGQWISNGHLSMPYGAVNEGDWWNGGTASIDGTVINRGHLTNTGIATTTGTIWNMGQIHSPGLLVNQGTIFNTGLLSATIANDGVIYSMGVFSGTIEGDGPVYRLQEHVYLPRVSK